MVGGGKVGGVGWWAVRWWFGRVCCVSPLGCALNREMQAVADGRAGVGELSRALEPGGPSPGGSLASGAGTWGRGGGAGLGGVGRGLGRRATGFLGEPGTLGKAGGLIGEVLEAAAAGGAGLVTYAPDDIDWEDEIRLAVEERASFSTDALTGLEANLRFAGPETMETKIFGRLTAWQNWIFQRPNAVGAGGALKLYGTGKRADFNEERV